MSAEPRYELAVLIASHERRERLRRCLDALSAQTLDAGAFEVIVADDASEDGTATAVEAYEAPFRLRVLRLAKMGKPAALNEAIAACEARICLFLDDDVIASPELLAEHLAAAERGRRVLAIGKLVQREPRRADWFGHAYAASWNERYEQLAEKSPDWADCYGANFSAPREALLEIEGFDAHLGAVEDIDLGYRLCEAGCAPVYLAGAEALHDDEKSRGRILGDIAGFGEFCVRFGEGRPTTRRRLLGWFLDTTPREALLRRLLLALRVPPRLIALPGRLLPGKGARQVWFGLLAKYAFWLGARRSMGRKRWRETTRGVPVLLYHAFAEDGASDTYVQPRRAFVRQMRLLAALRFRVISAEDLARLLREGRMPSRRSAVITIDDGYADNFEIAYPVLRKRHFPATVYMVSRGIGGRNEWNTDGAASGRPLLSLRQLRSMQEDGIQIGSHTQTHCCLPEASAETARREIFESRTDLEANGMNATTFAYPYGRLDDAVVELAGEAGYTGAYASHEPARAHLGSDPLRIPRLEIVGDEGTFRFLRKLLIGGL